MQGAGQKCGLNQEDHGQRNLNRHENLPGTAAAWCADARIESCPKADARKPERGNCSGQQRRRHGHGHGEREDDQVEIDSTNHSDWWQKPRGERREAKQPAKYPARGRDREHHCL
jgi:hypothetical protein